jgi:hypothetical protein
MTKDFQSMELAPAPRRVEAGVPYQPTGRDHVPELVAAAQAERRRSKAVADFLARQRAKLAEMQARGPAIKKPTWPTLRSADQASKDAAAARETLAAAIQTRKAAEADLHRVAEAVEHQRAVVSAAEAEAAKWTGADAEAHRFLAVNIGAELPADLLAKRSRRDAAAAALADAQGALQMLEADHHRAEVALEAVKTRVAEAVAGVKAAVMIVAAVAMMRHQREAFVLRRIILAAHDTPVDGRRGPLPPAVEIALREPEQPWQAIPMADRATYSDMWKRAVAALTVDPDAELKLS